MRQRLGLATALLGDPKVLVLDEPANGLDPEGIFWMRGLLRDFADRGGPVLLSSHLLSEVEAVADQLVVIGHGRIAAAGRKDELLASTTGGLAVTSLDDTALSRALQADDVSVASTRDGLVVDAAAEVVGRAALAAGVVLTGLASSAGHGLEELFFTMTAGSELGSDQASAPEARPSMEESR